MRVSRRSAWLGLGAALVVVAIAWNGFVGPAIDRANRTTEVPGITAAIAVHAAPDGRLVITESGDGSAANGRVLLLDPASGRSDVVLDGLDDPRAAGISAGGQVCATLGSDQGNPSQLRCTGGRSVALVLPAADALPKAIEAGDVVSDGGAGWYVADLGNDALLHVGASDDVAMLSASWQRQHFPNRPQAIVAKPDGSVLVAVADRVALAWPITATSELQIVATDGGTILAIAPASRGTFVLEMDKGGRSGRVLVCCGGAESYELTILTGIDSPQDLALLPDGRLAITSRGRVLLYRPNAPAWVG